MASVKVLKPRSIFSGLAIFASVLWCLGAPAQETPANRPVLKSVRQVRALPVADAKKSLPVVIHGTILDLASPVDRAVILSDETGGIYVLSDEPIFAGAVRGDAWEVSGVTDPGEFAPIIRARSARREGKGTIPEAVSVSYHQLLSGALDAQRVRIEGVVRRLEVPNANDIQRILVAVDGGLVPVRIMGAAQPTLQVDAAVRINAICLYQFNQRRQVITPVLQAPSMEDVTITRTAPADPYSVPLRSADSLLQFNPDTPTGHRVHVSGIVTYAQPETYVWIRDASSGLCIQTRETGSLKPGDLIDALGFPILGGNAPLLEDATVRKKGFVAPRFPPPSPPPSPPCSMRTILWPPPDCSQACRKPLKAMS